MNNMTNNRWAFLGGLCVSMALAAPTNGAWAEDESSAQSVFIASSFTGNVPDPKTLWLSGDLKKQVKKILKHAYPALRIRYWQRGDQTVWVLDEIGKYKPITVGVVIKDQTIERLKVLAYRESHGWEVRHDFFTRQFIGARLPKNHRLDRQIDGISGATLSVRALKKLAVLALVLDREVQPL